MTVWNPLFLVAQGCPSVGGNGIVGPAMKDYAKLDRKELVLEVEHLQAQLSEALESAYFPGSQGSSGSPWRLSIHRRNKVHKKALESERSALPYSGGNADFARVQGRKDGCDHGGLRSRDAPND